MPEITKEEFEIYGEISRLGADLWELSKKVVGLNTDPKMFSIMLFKRLWSNHRGYTLLYNNALHLEADIVLRSGLEAAICIAANFHLRDEFIMLMRRDAAYTLQGQIKMNRESADIDLVREAEANLRMLQAEMPQGVKAARLDWHSLSQQGQVPQLYGFHRMLSGVSSHVTGMSILTAATDADGSGEALQKEYRSLTRKFHLMMMAGATLQASMLHAEMIDEDEYVLKAKKIVDRMNMISVDWPK